jgi:hypothetical protein
VAHHGRKQKLYDMGVQAVRVAASPPPPGYLCPICFGCFVGLERLSEEHVPPESIGGRVLCLTCCRCNSNAGHSVDAQAHREHMARSFLAEGLTQRARIVIGELQVTVDLTRADNATNMRVLGAHNDPAKVSVLRGALSKIKDGDTFQIRGTVSYDRAKADISYLRTAYLGASAKLGYTYILRHSLDRVRQQICEPEREILKTVRVYGDIVAIPEKAFVLIDEPIACLAAKIRDMVVCLPLPDGDDLFYERLAEMRASGVVHTWKGSGTMEWPKGFELALDRGHII